MIIMAVAMFVAVIVLVYIFEFEVSKNSQISKKLHLLLEVGVLFLY